MNSNLISSAELKAFLHDIEKNITSDDDTDFKKLVLYLFDFANHKIINEDADLLGKIFKTVELVFDKKRFLLNTKVENGEVRGISEIEKGEDTLLYKWSTLFCIHHLSHHKRGSLIIGKVKIFMINLINLLATKLNNFKYTKGIKQLLLDTIQSKVDYLLEHIVNPDDEYMKCVFGCLHIFTILNDYDISNKLNLFNKKAIFESYSRKLWFVLSEAMISGSNADVANSLRSILILNITDKVCLDYTASWSEISLLLSLMLENMKGLVDQKSSDKMIKTYIYSLLKLFKVCHERSMVENYINFVDIEQLLENVPANFPRNLEKCLHFIHYHYSLLCNDHHTISKYHSASSDRYTDIKFNDPDLDMLRESIITINHENESSKVQTMLTILIDKDLQYSPFNDTFAFDYSDWLRYLMQLIKQEAKGTVKLDQHEIHSIISAVGYLPCLVNGDFDFHVDQCTVCDSCSTIKNIYAEVGVGRKSVLENDVIKKLYQFVFCNYISRKKVDFLKNDSLICCNFLLSVFRLFATFRPPKSNLQNEPILTFVFNQLSNNHNRDVRLLCARILPLYLLQPREKNLDTVYKYIFKKVNSIDFSTPNRRHFAESTIACFVYLSMVSNGEWLCVLMIKLIHLFGLANDQHVNYVYNGILSIASTKSVTPYKLLSPFFPSISEMIIKKERIFKKITESLGVTKKYFLFRTREYTTPRLLEYYKYDFVQEIAEASNMTKWKLIAKNLSRILATYFVKDNQINESYIMNVLSNISPEFKMISINDLMSNIGEMTWFVLLQIQVDENNNFVNEPRIRNALKYIAKYNISKKGHIIDGLKDFDYVRYLLGEHVLELVQRFSENVHHIKGSKPFLEKVSSLRAIEYLINKNINSVATALGQVSTCLQASLENPDFELLAIKCWNSLVQNLAPEHLISLIDITISLIFQRFTSFEDETKEVAVEILKKVFNEIKDKFREYSLYYLSIPFAPHIQDHKPISAFRLIKPASRLNYFQEFSRRLNTNNKYVVQQALDDLINYTSKYQLNCQSEYFKDYILEDDISELVRTLFDTASRFKNKSTNISTKCAKVLSIIGSLDPNRFHFKSMKHQIIIINDFNDFKENCSFLVNFIESKVLKIFWASNDPVKQLFSAYSMQRFLQVMSLDTKVLDSSNTGSSKEIWSRFSDIAKSTLTPLLSSKYVSPASNHEPIKYPFFRITMRYENWLVDFTSDLLKRPLTSIFGENDNKSKQIIFQTCSMLIRDQDISLCHYLLKYAALSHIINGNEEISNDLRKEIMSILTIDLQSTPSDRGDQLKACFNSIFEILDYFNEWVSAATHYLNDMNVSKSTGLKLKKNLDLVKNFLNEIPLDIIAIKSAQCDSYERTILYLEKCYRDGTINESSEIGDTNFVATLQSMYANMNDFDALHGILKKFSTNNLEEKLRTFKYNENWTLAQESFQVLSDVGDSKSQIENNTQLLKSLSDHGLYHEVLSTLASKIDLHSVHNIPLDWSLVGLQASITSGDIDHINKWLHITDSIGKPQDVETMINYYLGVGFRQLQASSVNHFNEALDVIFEMVGSSLMPSISSGFSRNLYLMRQLHVLYDISRIIETKYNSNETNVKEIEEILRLRLGNIDQGFESQWKVLSTHRVAYTFVLNNDKISDILLKSSSMARKNDRLDVSTRSIMNAMVLNDKDANIEYAELLWSRGKHTEAIKSLFEILKDDTFKDNQQKARAQLSYAKWLDISNHSSSNTIINEYTKALKVLNTWESPYYDLGKYYNKIMESKNDKSGYYEQQIIRHFLKALALGNTYIYEALPKLITIWLDFAQQPHRSKEAERRLNQINLDIEKYTDNIQVFIWYTSITQILSRIVHVHVQSARLLLKVIFNIVRTYPKHSLWFILSHLNSNDSLRKDRVSSVLNAIQSADPKFESTISGAKELFQSLIKMANLKIQKKSTRKLSLSQDFRITNLTSPYPSLVIPVRSNLEIRFHASGGSKFLAFPKAASITFDGFDDNVNIFHSLQMPRQVTVRGSNFKAYKLMIKKDDTRKDAKVVEFTTMINRLLSSSNEARKRNLLIHNYSVVPLAENMGVIEFVENVTTMKSIISEQRNKLGYMVNERKIFMKLDEAQKLLKANKTSNEDLVNLSQLFETIRTSNPPVLYNWFVDQFSDPTAWYFAKNAFTRSAAVMSVVGYIVGLGDRHCENILFFKGNGSVLHIDFDCLFEKGKTLPTPEIVPFRLTQNLTDAMGINGIEGTFRISCEVTGTLLRENEESLMNILETLLYDPLLDWKTQQDPQDNLRIVRRKIRGFLDEKEGLPMNIHGQIDILIQEACSTENLAQMYGGWAPYV